MGHSLAVPRLSVCADVQKVDRTKLAQTEVKSILYKGIPYSFQGKY